MPQGIKKINETSFAQIKKYIETNGAKAAEEKYGYSAATIRSLKSAADYTSWRTKRRAQQSKRRSPGTPVQPVEKTQAIQPVAQTQSVTSPEIKKPGHGRPTPQRPQQPARLERHDQFFVTREQHDRDLRNQAQLTNRALEQVGKLGKEVRGLTKEDAAYRQADILLADKAKKSRWQRFVDGIREGFRS
ncbi:hypothetical protein GTC6_05427 [Gordonia terrae C-6]|uniref:Uncharacterized protein n=1 Tax=Gordonia terrae C-6 TaxID=1316928 RepID=R7YCT0_9ACTN|nr:hypothetical protein [Gordonia terrae]EON33782.1 hypothetical protein GTC6_05427 [Gordonia terrae C-6]